MDSACRALIVERIRQRGPITVAEFMDLALYAPEVGYYARAARRSGRAGDFFTSVDTGPVFGALLAERFARFWRASGSGRLDLVEAGAGNGRLTRDILDAASGRDPDFYHAIAAHLVERSSRARAAHRETLAAHDARLAYSGEEMPDRIDGIVFANELLDALPVHLVEMGDAGLLEVYVGLEAGRLVDGTGPPSDPALAGYLGDAGVTLERGARAEINLAAVDWVARTGARLHRGFLVLIDYGYEAVELYSAARSQGTLATYHRRVDQMPVGGAPPGGPAWLASRR
ncbi:MAG: SAM-dependent methyltransferase [Vicinamibacterales bacterium]